MAEIQGGDGRGRALVSLVVVRGGWGRKGDTGRISGMG